MRAINGESPSLSKHAMCCTGPLKALCAQPELGADLTFKGLMTFERNKPPPNNSRKSFHRIEAQTSAKFSGSKGRQNPRTTCRLSLSPLEALSNRRAQISRCCCRYSRCSLVVAISSFPVNFQFSANLSESAASTDFGLCGPRKSCAQKPWARHKQAAEMSAQQMLLPPLQPESSPASGGQAAV